MENNVLVSWNDGAPKQSIIDFVRRVTTAGGPDFVPVSGRIAVFDNDGTLWAESPLPVQLIFALERVRALAPQHPEWKEKQPFKAVLENNLKTCGLRHGGPRGDGDGHSCGRDDGGVRSHREGLAGIGPPCEIPAPLCGALLSIDAGAAGLPASPRFSKHSLFRAGSSSCGRSVKPRMRFLPSRSSAAAS